MQEKQDGLRVQESLARRLNKPMQTFSAEKTELMAATQQLMHEE